jgi:phosphoserine phosphatase RsbU/P
MRDKLYLVSFFIISGILPYVGRGLLLDSALVTLGLTFAGTTAAGVLGLSLYRVQLELRASRRELARKQAELSFAREVQQALFPQQYPSDGGLEFAGVCLPASGISGDYFDVLQLPGQQLAFAIADISGKGISAAILMSNLHAVLRTLALEGHPPGSLGLRLNNHLYQVTGGLRYATLFYGEWNPATRTLRYINAGHNVPILICKKNTCRLPAGSPPVGIFGTGEFPEMSLSLQGGDTLVLFSDGVTDAMNDRDEDFGEPRLEAVALEARDRPLVEIQQRVLKALRDWARGDQEDDMTLLLVRVTKAGKEES